MDRQHRSPGAGALVGAVGPSSISPGKQTLVEQIQRKAAPVVSAPPRLDDNQPGSAVAAAQASSGAPVDPAMRDKVEAATGSDLSGARVRRRQRHAAGWWVAIPRAGNHPPCSRSARRRDAADGRSAARHSQRAVSRHSDRSRRRARAMGWRRRGRCGLSRRVHRRGVRPAPLPAAGDAGHQRSRRDSTSRAAAITSWCRRRILSATPRARPLLRSPRRTASPWGACAQRTRASTLPH